MLLCTLGEFTLLMALGLAGGARFSKFKTFNDYKSDLSREEATRCPFGWKRSPETSLCYKLFTQLETAKDAASVCEEHGGVLARLPDSLVHTVHTLAAGTSITNRIWYQRSFRKSPFCKVLQVKEESKKVEIDCIEKHGFLCSQATEQAKICPDKILCKNFCYTLLDATPFGVAEAKCHEMGGELAVITGTDVYSFIQKQLSAHDISPDRPVWLGLKANRLTKRWLWSKNHEVAMNSTLFRLFAKRFHPSNSNACGALVRNNEASIIADDCTQYRPAFCAYPVSDDLELKHKADKEILEEKTAKEKVRKSTVPNIFSINEQVSSHLKLTESDMILPELQDDETLAKMEAEKATKELNSAASKDELENVIKKYGVSTNHLRSKRNVLKSKYHPTYIWSRPEGSDYTVIPYDLDKSSYLTWDSGDEALHNITTAMADIEDKTCLRFVNRTDETSYLRIGNTNTGCWATVGKRPGAPTEVSLMFTGDISCTHVGTVQHELIHALGFMHEHSRPDRDDNIDIIEENIQLDKLSQFAKRDDITETMGVRYDCLSVMHYALNAFSSNTYDTIRPKPGTLCYAVRAQIGQREMMSSVDYMELNMLYDCNVVVDGGWSEWSEWSTCSASCEGGESSRTRTCTEPAPSGGEDCQGSPAQYIACMQEPCTQEYTWFGCWSDESDDTIPDSLMSLEGSSNHLDGNYTDRIDRLNKCAKAAQEWDLEYFALKYGGKCYGQDPNSVVKFWEEIPSRASVECKDGHGTLNSIDAYRLGTAVSGQWGPWSELSSCSQSCGPGTRSRTRACNNPTPTEGEADCVGSDKDIQNCQKQECPIHGGWGEWTEWDNSYCNTGCGESKGIQTRYRSCTDPTPQYGGDNCEGHKIESESCPPLPPCTTTTTTTTDAATTTAGYQLDEGLLVHFPFEKREGDQLGDGYNHLVEKGTVLPDQGRIGNGILLENGGYGLGGADNSLSTCIYDPDTCTSGFSVSLWFKQTVEQRATNMRPYYLISFGPEASGATTPAEGLGVSLYIEKSGMVKAQVRTRTKDYVADHPSEYYDNDDWHQIALTWNTEMKELKLYYKGILANDVVASRSNVNDPHTVFNYFMLGRPVECNDHFYEGYLDEVKIWERTLTAGEVYQEYTRAPMLCSDCDHNTDSCYDFNPMCICSIGYHGDGYYCQKEAKLDLDTFPLGMPVYFWPMNKIVNYEVEAHKPLLTHEQMHTSLGIQDKAIFFDGRRDFMQAEFDEGCLVNPGTCPGGFSLVYWLLYDGRGQKKMRKNYIFSSGAEQDSIRGEGKGRLRGISLYVSGLTGYAEVRTENHHFKTNFAINRNVWMHMVMSWSAAGGLDVYLNGQLVGRDLVADPEPANPMEEGNLLIGKPFNVYGFNGRFHLDNVAIWLSPMSKEHVDMLFNEGLAEQSPPRL